MRQSASSRRKAASSIGRSISWRPITAVGNSMAKATSKRSAGFSAARLSPSTTSTVSRISMKRRPAACGRRPARSSSRTNGSAEPSMIGISGPSSSTSALSMPDMTRAAIRCSMVATVTPASLVITVPSWVLHTDVGVAGTTLSRSVMSMRTKLTPAFDAGRPHGDLGVGAGVDAHTRKQRRCLDRVLEGAALETVCRHAGTFLKELALARDANPSVRLSRLVRRNKTTLVSQCFGSRRVNGRLPNGNAAATLRLPRRARKLSRFS